MKDQERERDGQHNGYCSAGTHSSGGEINTEVAYRKEAEAEDRKPKEEDHEIFDGEIMNEGAGPSNTPPKVEEQKGDLI